MKMSELHTWVTDLEYALNKKHNDLYVLKMYFWQNRVGSIPAVRERIVDEDRKNQLQNPDIQTLFIQIFDKRYFNFINEGNKKMIGDGLFGIYHARELKQQTVKITIKEDSLLGVNSFNVKFEVAGRHVDKRNNITRTTKPRVAIREIVTAFKQQSHWEVCQDFMKSGEEITAFYKRNLIDKFTKNIPCSEKVVQTLCEEVMAIGEDTKFTTDLFKDVVKNALPNYKKYVKYADCNYNFHVVTKDHDKDEYRVVSVYNYETIRYVKCKSLQEFIEAPDRTVREYTSQNFECLSDAIKSGISLLDVKAQNSHALIDSVGGLMIGDYVKVYILTERVA